MGLGEALTALLLRGPAHGYQLLATLEAELGPLWQTRPSQVYLTLGRLQRDDLVIGERQPQASRPGRTVFRLTDRGQAMAEAWLTSPGSSDEVPVRLAVARLAVPDRYADLIGQISAERMASLRRLRALRSQTGGGFQPEAIEREIRVTEADVRWLTDLAASADATVARPPARQLGRRLKVMRDA